MPFGLFLPGSASGAPNEIKRKQIEKNYSLYKSTKDLFSNIVLVDMGSLRNGKGA